MEIKETPIKGLLIVQPRVFDDPRGYFFESYNENEFKKHGLDSKFVQDNISRSQKGVLRGLHFQNPPHAQGKLVRVIKGAVLDVVVDIRQKSSTYGQHFKLELNENNKTALWVPPGFAHGFATLENDTIFTYKCTDFYNREAEETILWNDPVLGIDWNVENPILSDKDKHGKPFNNFISKF